MSINPISSSSPLRSFVTKQPKAILSIDWNSLNENNLVVGYEKGKSSSSGIIWDISTGQSLQLPQCEGPAFLKYLPSEEHLLACSSQRQLRIIDDRSKDAYEIDFCPYNTGKEFMFEVSKSNAHKLLTSPLSPSSQEAIKLWDLRFPSLRSSTTSSSNRRPIGEIVPSSHPSSLKKVLWGEEVLHLLFEPNSLECWNTSKEDSPYPQFRQNLLLEGENEGIVSDMIWIPRLSQDQDAGGGGATSFAAFSFIEPLTIRVLPISDKWTLASSPGTNSQLITSEGEGLTSFENGDQHSHGILDEMERRAEIGYSVNPARNLQILSEEEPSHTIRELQSVWGWVDRVTTAEHISDEEKGLNAQSKDKEEEDEDDEDDPPTSEHLPPTSSTSLLDSGVESILFPSKISSSVSLSSISPLSPSIETFFERFSLPIYLSSPRSKVLELCGWCSDIFYPDHSSSRNLVQLVNDADLDDQTDRAIALAVFHGKFDLAIQTIEKLIGSMAEVDSPSLYSPSATFDGNSSSESFTFSKIIDGGGRIGGNDSASPSSIQSILQLVACLFSGFNISTILPTFESESPNGNYHRDDDNSPTTNSIELWRRMCLDVISKLKSEEGGHLIHLIVVCEFLYIISDPELHLKLFSPIQKFSPILESTDIALSDRVAFASIFLSDEELGKYLDGRFRICISGGSLEGILLTGFRKKGISLLQSYLDHTSDVQTVALLVSILPNQMIHTIQLVEWVEEYRSFLNRRELFHERAVFDSTCHIVHCKHSSHYKNTIISSTSTPSHKTPQSSSSSRSSKRGKRSKGGGKGQKNVQAKEIENEEGKSGHKLPSNLFHLAQTKTPHLFIRCNLCYKPLSLDFSSTQKDRETSEWMRTQRPVLNYCQHCKNLLPKCYVCQLQLGSINPYLELQRLQQQRSVVDSSSGGGSKSREQEEEGFGEFGSLSFAGWFSWCQKCRHGGHAHCMEEWFETRSGCGVQGCDCECGML